MARRFLWIFAVIILLIIAIGVVWQLAGDRLLRAAMVPGVRFAESAQAPAPDYARPAAWLARPGLASDPTRWTPADYRPAPKPAAATFFVNGTAFFGRDRWNAPLDDAGTNERLAKFARAQGSIFNGVSAVWVPRYRQATFGSFLVQQPNADAEAALDFAYGDVLRAFDAFVAAQAPGTPIILAGHSQGALHLLRLLRERVAGQPLAKRLVAVYAVGWPVSVSTDLSALGLPGCTRREQAGCVLSWQSWAADGDPAPLLAVYDAGTGFDGRPRRGTAALCVNPLTGGGGAAKAETNIGTLVGDGLVAKRVGAACDKRGLLILTPDLPDLGPYVLPGGNWHTYDMHLFWANLRADVEARLGVFGGASAGAR
ncbi:DUF3089 domain-containing protein [Sandaracinobacteroides saxicola]|uniref:DUF3089 domain-containing protein n=1 Tax=Sandaracinobacteroides saxicola TaxID=2759707 RepID=A0A7G5IKF0_9SPHN|nr:DUF3089 domain-containing protein [Sandaracinobacteroides saxicola]QMW23842.1 DUF3089 domain-containing protein [Sandaracinobacteroides saxicola]